MVVRQQHKHHFGEMSANDCFQFCMSGPSHCAVVDFFVLEVFNSNNLFKRSSCRFKDTKAFGNSFARSSKRPNFFKLKTYFAAAKIMP